MPIRAGAFAALLALTGCASPELAVVGTVRDTTVTVPAPAVEAPVIDLDAGFAAVGAPDSPAQAAVVVVASVAVSQGGQVAAGDTLATLDDAAQRASVAAAKADASLAMAQVDVLSQTIEDADDKASTLASQRQKATKAINTLTSNQKKLKKTLSSLASTRKQLTGKLAAARKALAGLPPPGTPLPPGVPPPPRAQLTRSVATLKAAIAKLDAGRKKAQAGLKKLASGLKKARAGLVRLNKARTTLDDAKQQLRDAKELAQVASDGSSVGVDAANWQLGLATVAAPVSGTVVSVVKPGAVLAPGAPLAVIRPDSPALVDAWVSPAQRSQLCPDARALVQGDWMSAPLHATLTDLGSRATYPPANTATDETHLTRAFQVTVQLSEGPDSARPRLPAGVPATITFPSSESDCHG